MNIRDLEHDDHSGDQPPTADILAAEYVLGVLNTDERRDVEARIERDPGFARLVEDWEHRWSPLLLSQQMGTIEPPAHLWPRIRTSLGWSPLSSDAVADRTSVAPRGLWQNTGFWRAAAGLAAAAAIAAVLFGRLQPTGEIPGPGPVVLAPTPPVEDPNAPKPVTTLAHDDGSPGWLASVDTAQGTVLMVPVPAGADDKGRVPELWLIPPGESAKSLGIVSINRAHTVKVPDALRRGLSKGAILAITLEPPGGAPKGVATGPIIAKGDIVTL